MTTSSSSPVRAGPVPASGVRSGPAAAAASGAMVLVGGSVAVSGVLAGSPLYTAQALRYAVASVLLVLLAHRMRRPVARPRGREWLWLAGVTGCGLVVFNVALVHGSRHAEPAVLGVAVAGVPVLLAVAGPLLEGRRPTGRAVLAAAIVTAGAALVQGLGRADAIGLGWAAVVFVCEAGFTLLAVPLLRTIGPFGVSVHTTWLAAVAFAVLGLTGEGPAALTRLTSTDLLACAYLAVGVTAVAFVLWYTGVQRLGAARAGLLTGVAPVAAAAAGTALGAGPPPGPAVWAGVAVVAVGLATGLGARRSGGRDGRRAAEIVTVGQD